MSSYDSDEPQFTETIDGGEVMDTSDNDDDDDDREDGMEADDTNSEAEEDSEVEDNDNLEGPQVPQRKNKYEVLLDA